ncbi:fumarylacetoacetase [Catenuloplanes nepalensis]|uniref:Fumarylacetoacetase n=1 Tax=Catenuloplanes nepalensis TaxID=587533 RepID=A0ABT9ML11_9ACTN|nr:fumarylacetoacetate hydrolase family protein [Catenuloplanes nepalensis]MDP9792095.1 fumarylacetoacetase [Catenuloplanes nepalensis]
MSYGVFSVGDGPRRLGALAGDRVIDLSAAGIFAATSLNPLLAAGPAVWHEVHGRLAGVDLERHSHPAATVRMHRPFDVADYADFYASEHHATNVGRIFRPEAPPLHPNWKHLPIGYHGRAGTVVVSGTDVRRPAGPLGPGEFGPTRKLDFEAEIGFVVGVPAGGPVRCDDFAEHVFGVCLVNDWSARDVQRWEATPLGPFLGKSFATSIGAWVVPLHALGAARTAAPRQDPAPLPYLRGDRPWALDLQIEIRINGYVVSRPRFADMYWTPDQMLAHLTVNGAALRTGDLFASGTVSGPSRDQRGCLLELSWDGRDPLPLADGESRAYLEDGDTVTISAAGPGGVSLGTVAGTVRPCA